MIRWTWWLLSIWLGACASNPPTLATAPRPTVPERTRTSGDDLLSLVPEGADVLLELDIARLRENPTLAPVVAGLASIGPEILRGVDGMIASDFSVFRQADTVIWCSYHVGEDRATTITLIRGDVPLGTRLDDRTHVLGPPDWIARVLRVTEGVEPSLAGDVGFMTVRTRAMPPRAKGAFFRATAHLDFDARVELANRLDIDAAPETLSVWGDVADDLAIISTMSGSVPAEGNLLARALTRGRDRLAQVPWVRASYLHFTVRGVDITVSDGNARAVLIIGPRRLQNMIKRLMRILGIEVQQSPNTSN